MLLFSVIYSVQTRKEVFTRRLMVVRRGITSSLSMRIPDSLTSLSILPTRRRCTPHRINDAELHGASMAADQAQEYGRPLTQARPGRSSTEVDCLKDYSVALVSMCRDRIPTSSTHRWKSAQVLGPAAKRKHSAARPGRALSVLHRP